VIQAILPYGLIVALVLATRLVPPLSEALRSVDLTWSIGGVFRGELLPLYHPGAILLAGLLVGGLFQGRTLAEFGTAAAAAAGRLILVAAALLAMLALSRVMVHAGMIEVLAGAAAATGGLWPFIAPFTGVLGTFVTGSATASNILLTPFQSNAAAALNLPPVSMTAAQGFGAGIGNIICPHNIVAGGATVGLNGQEGEVLRQTLAVCLPSVAVAGVLVFWLTLQA
jgi:lactate permease